MSAVILVNPKLSNAEATSDVQPIMDWVSTFPAEKIVANGVFPVETFYQAFTQFLVGPSGVSVFAMVCALADESDRKRHLLDNLLLLVLDYSLKNFGLLLLSTRLSSELLPSTLILD